MIRLAGTWALALAALGGELIDSMDDLRARLSKDKVRVETVEGKFGRAARFAFDDGCQSVFAMTSIRGAPEWDRARGFSFWVKGDGSRRFGGLQFIWNEDYSARYDLMFPIDGTEWRKIDVAWEDLVPVLPKSPFLDPKGPRTPSRLSALWFGKWWYWRDYGAHSYAIDEMRLEGALERGPAPAAPGGAPLERVLARLKAGRPVTIVTMGDSLTDFQHWANKPVNWPTLLAARLKEKYGSEVRLINPAIGGTQLRQGLVLLPRWRAEAPEPDLVTILYGYNDWDAGMRGEEFRETLQEAVDRVRRATGGRADVLLLTTCPALDRWTTMSPLAEAVRSAAADRRAGLADLEKAFHAVPEAEREKLFCRDRAHLGPAGHETVAGTVLSAIEKAGR
ncbi:MAG TPA: GDSL-type esterase/lipase family protein [Planctomycetota bacterium]|nr:GDSL-type esterase/lipase family protein [Planctomycetota bacterium]